MANPTSVVITDLNGNAFAVSGTTSGVQKGAPTPVVLTDVNGNALVFGAAAIPNGSTATTQAPLSNDTKVATDAYADAAVAVEVAARIAADALKANLASPALTGSPTAPTQAIFSNDTKIATDAYVDAVMRSVGLTWFREDFTSAPTSAFTTAGLFNCETPWVALQIVASCTPSQPVAQTYINQGIVRLTTGAVSGNGGVIYKGNGAAVLGALQANTNWEANFIARVGQTATCAFRMGFVIQGQEAADAPTDWMGIRYDTAAADTKYTFETRAASTSTVSVVNSINADTSFHHFRIRSTAAGTILFSVDNGIETSIATNVPTAIVKPFFQALTRTTAASFAEWDFINYVAVNGRS